MTSFYLGMTLGIAVGALLAGAIVFYLEKPYIDFVMYYWKRRK